jgi:ABC-2 type transport system permease protein/sodium transport system permease protein
VDPQKQPVTPSSPLPGTGRLIRLARKELTEILRDRRTIVTLVVMPLLLYPLLTIAFGQFVLGGKIAEQMPEYRLGFRSEAEKETLMPFLNRGMTALNEERIGGPLAKLNAKVLKPLGDDPEDPLDEAVRRGEVDLGLRLRRRAPSPTALGSAVLQAGARQPFWQVCWSAEARIKDIVSDRPFEWELIYRTDNVRAMDAIHALEQVLTTADSVFARQNMRMFHLRPPPLMQLKPVPIAVEGNSGLSMAVFVPLVLILMTMTGAVYPAIDLTAGERERGTLEILIAAPVPRVSLLFAKYVAVVTVAVLTALVNLGAMMISLLVSDVGEKLFGTNGFRAVTLLEIFGLVLLFAAFFSALLLVLTSFARSFKEAQAYLIPLMVVSLVPGILGLLPGLSLSGPLVVVPLLNIVLLSRDLLDGRAEPISAAVVVISTATYAVLAVVVAGQVFGSSGVLYGESGGWRALLRRGRSEVPEG